MKKRSAAVVAFIAIAGCLAGPVDATPGHAAWRRVASPDPSARIRFGHYLGIDSWDPALSPGGPDIPLMNLVYDSLVHVDPLGAPSPGLAESWTYADDGMSVEFVLRDGVTFTDGEVFDAQVAKANLDRSISLEDSRIRQQLIAVEDVEVVDTYTLRIDLATPDTTIPLVLADRPGFMVSPAILDQNPITEPVGSGMFALVDEVHGQSFSVDANPDYWDPGVVQVAGVDMTVLNDSTTRLNALATGAIDLALIDSAQIADAEARGLEVITGPNPQLFSLQLNPDVEPALAEPNVRLALSLAIDRDGIVSGLFFGNGVALDQVFLPGTPSYNDDIEGAWTRDLDRARQLLADAGYPDGFGFTVVIGTEPLQGQITEALQAQLAEIGVDIEIRRLEGFGPAEAFWTDKTEAGAMFRVTSTLAPAGMIQKLYTAGVTQNPGNVTSPTIDSLLAQAFAETDPDLVAELMQQISAELVEAPLNVIPLAQEQVVLASVPAVEGQTTWLTGFPNFTNVSMAR